MRNINLRQFLKIIKGEDLEFRISPFAFKLNEPVLVKDSHLPYDLNFRACHFEKLTFKNCRFSGNLEFIDSNIETLSFDSCLLHNLEATGVDIGHISIENSNEFRSLIIKDSNVNDLILLNNPIYETIHLGCGNNIRTCTLEKNGVSEVNSFSTKVFICPERFEVMRIKNLTTDILHVGTFGQYARLNIADVNAECVLIDGCSFSTSKVSFKNIQPRDKEASAFHLINTVFDQEIFGEKAFRNYKVTKTHHQKVDVSTLVN